MGGDTSQTPAENLGGMSASGGMSAQGGADNQGGMGGAGGTTGGPLPEGVPAEYSLVFEESFAAETALSSVLAGNPGAWSFDAGEGALQFSGTGYAPPAPVPESLTSFALVSPQRFSSFVLEVELKQLNPDTAQPHRDLCIVFNITSETQYYYAHIAQTHDDRSHNIHLINDAPRNPITVTDNGGISWGSDEWHKFRLVRDAVGGSIEVFMDDNLTTPILTASDTTLSDGYVGFGTFQDSGRVRNLRVWAAAPNETAAPATFFD
jgi:hypothetical protein